MEADHDAVPLSFRSGADNTAHQRNQSGDYQNPANSKLHGVFCVLVQVTFRDAPKQRPRKIPPEDNTDVRLDPGKAVMVYKPVRTTEMSGQLVRTQFFGEQVPKS
jgi:hypothetical protein